jgi:hypothetical protein
MKMVMVLAAAMLLVGFAQVVLAEPPGKERGKELVALEQKMLGTWKGQTTCDGRLVFRADGTYELTLFSAPLFGKQVQAASVSECQPAWGKGGKTWASNCAGVGNPNCRRICC